MIFTISFKGVSADNISVKKYSKDEIAVLLVDDNEKNLKNFHYILKNNGFYVVKAESGFEALSTLEEEEFHAILMANTMELMQGSEVSMLVRESFNKGELPILIYDKDCEPEKTENAKSYGANDFLSLSDPNGIIKRLKSLYTLREKYLLAMKEKKGKKLA